jgi:hypothetical protein
MKGTSTMTRTTRILLKVLAAVAVVAATGLALHFLVRGLIALHGG